MAKNLQFQIKYTGGGYLDSNIAISSIPELKEKFDFVGQSVHMPEAFNSANGVPYPIDFWMTPNGEDIKWEIKTMPTIESTEDFERFKFFCEDFKMAFEYYPLTKGQKINVAGEEFEFFIDKEGKSTWVSIQDNFDETISDAVKIAIDNITSGASEAFDTLKEIEDWIKANSGSTSTPGADGKDGITPQLKIENGVWFVSYNEGETWEELGKATGDKGESGENGADGKSAYQIWLDAGNDGSEADFLASLKGEQGIQGEKGDKGALDEEQIASLKGEIKSYTDEEISKIEIPTLDGVATEEWVNNQGFIKEHQDISHLATSADVASAIQKVEQKIPSLDGYATETFVKNAIADAQLSGGTDIDLSGYATKDDIKNLASKDEIVTYTNGDGILIDETNKISVKIAKDTVEKENFIEINENNELELNEITLDAAVISEDIEVNGGAWADEIETVFDGKIPAGITFEDFLKRMVKKEKYVREVSTIRNFEVVLSGDTPTLTSNGVNVNEKIVEIGTQVKFSQVNPFSTIATQSISAGTFTYGYKIGENGEYNSSQLYTLGLKPDLIESASTIQVTFTKLSQDLNGTIPVENIYVTDGNNVNEVIAYVNEGYNSITLCQTGDTYSSNSNIVNKDIYVATSLKNYTTENGEANIYELTFPVTSATASNKITYHVTGAKKYYIGGINEYSKDYWTKGNPSDILRNLELQNWVSGSTIETSYTFKEGTKQQTVAVPAEYTKVIGTDRIGGPVNFEMVAENINFYNQQGYSCKYNVFVAPAYDGLSTKSFINITIEK